LLFGLRNSGEKQVATSAPVTPVATPAPAAATQPAPRETAPSKVMVALNANAPNARVTFRRRVSAAPSTMQITPSDIVELVEVSAPGYKTVRYWLTFDRPTTLDAKLKKGSGMEEATEEATLIALGELAAPAPVRHEVAAAKPVEVAKVKQEIVAEPVAVAKPVEIVAKEPAAKKDKVPTPRKIGRGTEVATEVASNSEATVAPVADEPKADPMPEAKTEAKIEAKPEPILEPKAEPKPEPKLEAAVAKPSPSIDKGVVMSVIGKHRPEVLKCLAEGKKKNATMKGTVNLQLQVDAAGKVRAQVQSTLNAPMVAACVIKAASSWTFPARAGGEVATVVYPFTIN
jgi:hypothetical protein